MKPYDIKDRLKCPKCGMRWMKPIEVKYQPGQHGFDCRMEYEHLHGHCGFCGYDGVEYIFTVADKKE